MSDGPEWFAPKRYGFGSGLPIAWQGWVILIAFLIFVIATAMLIDGDDWRILTVVAPVTLLFMWVVARTTRGGWRWRWGEKD